MTLSSYSLPAILATSLLVACGGSSGGSSTDPDTAVTPPDNTTQPDTQPEPSAPPVSAGGDFFAYYTRLSTATASDLSAGPYADIVVNLGQQGQLIFSRASSYRPVWHFDGQQQAVEQLADIQAASELQFDGNQGFAYARIIEQSADEVLVHWRYLKRPQADQARNPTAVVHELYRIRATGEVTRTYRPGTDSIDDWHNRSGAKMQQLQLTTSGIELVMNKELAVASPVTVPANPLLTLSPGDQLLAHWRFDELQGTSANDSQGAAHASIDSHGGHWHAGVSAGALLLDGYRTQAQVNGNALNNLNSEFSVQAWLNLAALPWNTAPILHRSQQFGQQGFYFGVGADGKLLVTLNGQTVQSGQAITRQQWAQVAVSVGQDIVLYINGNEAARAVRQADVQMPNTPWLMGLNNIALAASDGVRADDLDEYHHFSSIFGLEGLLDEVTVHNAALSPAAMADAYQSVQQQGLAQLPHQPKPRALPDVNVLPQQFGASHTRLDFHPQWDNLWRVPEYEDIVVRFDDKPVSYVYWRGTSHGMNLVTDNYWMSDQSVEMIIPDLTDPENDGVPFNNIVTLAEHMSDKAALRTHVRLIENSAARVKVHWRYAAADVFGTPILDNAFIDEVHTIYPDGIAIRSVFYHPAANSDEGPAPGVVFYQDFQWLAGPGQRAEQFMHRNAVSLAELSGSAKDLIYPYEYQDDEEGQSIPEVGQIAVLNSKTPWKVFGIAQGNTFYPSGNDERSSHISYEGSDFPFAGPWNHWPVAQIPSDGRFARDYDRVSHFALGVLEAFNYGSGSMMYGFTESDANALGDPTALQALAKSWHQPATVQVVSGVQSGSVRYNKNERAFEMQYGSGSEVQLQFQASTEQPLWNPALVIKRWPNSSLPAVSVNGAIANDARMAIQRDTDGHRMLVLYLPGQYTNTTELSLSTTQ
ncbi:hypothetical protein CHH28_02410 [Bacterioplanes sanyensis]|uniref:LamG-like jellyroll fold domain-containing protein n=1 Tax=Bacterioplanes sanyensis TaxID=1249553 RepID=A0A222FH84_9GAMM|nr:LamG domain-containing protein [Bacterioplanes sanyensis]ASP37593.1 hypothetical protein CHH28_02410 [Bacterioplanes sanyensis]